MARRSHDTRPPTRPPSPLPPPSPDVFSEETPRAPARIPSSSDNEAPQQKRLAMFTEMLSSGTSSLARGPAQLLPGARAAAASPAPVIAPSTSGGASSNWTVVHTSPSKVRR